MADDLMLEALQVWRNENLIDYVLADLDTRIKKDKTVKLSVFFTALSAYSKEPINLFPKGESGVGKTYDTTETLKYFPQEDVWYLGGLSQKALIHSHGILLDKDGEEIDLDSKPGKPSKKECETSEQYTEALKKYEEDVKDFRERMCGSFTLIDLRTKVLVFLESPDYGTLQMLKPILSHDKDEIEYRFVDKTGKGRLQTMTVKIRGQPAMICCTASLRYMEELATRSFTTTPENSPEKILAANVLTNLKASCPWRYDKPTFEFQVIERLIENLKERLSEIDIDVVVPFLNLYEFFPKSISRDMRDFQHFTQFLKTVTLLHYYQRPYMKLNKTMFLLSTFEDVSKAFDVYHELFETTRSGTEKRILDFYHNIVKSRPITTVKDDKEEPVLEDDGKPKIDCNPSWYLSQLTAKYNKTARKKLSEDSVRVMLSQLDRIGYVNTSKDPDNKKLNVYTPLIKEGDKDENCLKIDIRESLKPKLEEGFKLWSNSQSRNTPYHIMKNNSDKTWGESEITPEQLSEYVLSEKKTADVEGGNSRLTTDKDSTFKQETKPMNNRVGETKQLSPNSTGQLEANFLWRRVEPAEKCELCGEFCVEYEINDLNGRQTLRRCESCFKKMRNTYRNAKWQEGSA